MSSFDIMYKSLSNIKLTTQQIQIDIKNLEKELKKIEKAHNKISSTNNKKSGFAKPGPISQELCEFMDLPEGSVIARTDVTKFISNYIKTNSLQDLQNKKHILPDNKLKKLLKLSDCDILTYFNIQKYMNRHYI